jgi:hypothetical protein
MWLLASVLCAGLLTLSAVMAGAQGKPTVTTECCPEYCCGQARLFGLVNPNGLTTTVYFQYGINTSYGYVSPNQTFTGTTVQDVYAWIDIIWGQPTNHYRIVAYNSDGTVYGSDESFPITNCGPCSVGFAETLDARVHSFGLSHGIENSLRAKLSSAMVSLNAGQPHAACGQVGAFINQVHAQAGKAIPLAEADELILAADLLRASLGCSRGP